MFQNMQNHNKIKKIILSGGGTLGSVTPLIAICNELKSNNINNIEFDFLFVGSKNGVEKKFVKSLGIDYNSISSGKLRRYFSFQNFIDVFYILKGFVDSFKLIKKYKPNLILTAGSFVSVPLVIIAWLFKVPIFVFQLDIKVGLANKIMAIFATKITVTFENNLKDFAQKKVVLTGSPIRKELFCGSSLKARQIFDSPPPKADGEQNSLKTVFILGGGIGSQEINNLVLNSKDELLKKCNIIHITGIQKNIELFNFNTQNGVYRVIEFINNEIADVFALCDIVVTRAGMATLYEVAVLQKPMIVIPILNHQQEDNAKFFEQHNACINLQNRSVNNFVNTVFNLIEDDNKKNILIQSAKKLVNPLASKIIADLVIKEILKTKKV